MSVPLLGDVFGLEMEERIYPALNGSSALSVVVIIASHSLPEPTDTACADWAPWAVGQRA